MHHLYGGVLLFFSGSTGKITHTRIRKITMAKAPDQIICDCKRVISLERVNALSGSLAEKHQSKFYLRGSICDQCGGHEETKVLACPHTICYECVAKYLFDGTTKTKSGCWKTE